VHTQPPKESDGPFSNDSIQTACTLGMSSGAVQVRSDKSYRMARFEWIPSAPTGITITTLATAIYHLKR